MLRVNSADRLVDLAKHKDLPGLYSAHRVSADVSEARHGGGVESAELLPSLLAGGGAAAAGSPGRRGRRCRTAPSGGFAAAAAVVGLGGPDATEGGCLPFGLSRWRRTKKSATVDFTNQVLSSAEGVRGRPERRPRSILRKPSQENGGEGSEEEAMRAARRATSRVRFASTVSVAKVSIVRLKDDSPKRPTSRARLCEGMGGSNVAATAIRAALQQHSSEDPEESPSEFEATL